MQNSTLFGHGLGIGDGGAEVTVPIQPTVKTGPLTVPVSGVGQAPRNERVGLIVAFDFPSRFSCVEGHLKKIQLINDSKYNAKKKDELFQQAFFFQCSGRSVSLLSLKIRLDQVR